MKNRKKRLRQLIVALLLLCTIGLPIQNIVLANELSTTEEVITEEVEINEDKTIASEESEQPTEEGIQEEKEISEEATSAVTETVSSEQQPEEIIDSKEEVEAKESNQPVEVEKTIKKDVKAISPDKISSIFPDATLAEVIRDTLGKSSVDDIVTQAELDTITRVIAQSKGIVNLSGMENLTDLSYLDLGNNQISDISPLSNVTILSYLDLENNQISDISLLSNLTKLSYLDLENNQISDISLLSNLTNLVYLDLENNQISDISPLSNLTKLAILSLAVNQISDISPLSNLTNLELLPLAENQISDISPLSNLTKLNYLFLDNQNISASKVKWNDPLSVTNTIKDLNGNLIAPSTMSDQGTYTDPTITWTGLTNTSQSVSYEWSQSVTIGTATTIFYGTFNLPVEKSAQYNLFFDIDGQVTTELVEVGELVTKPQDPNKDGYAFIGWYDAETGGNEWDFSTDTMPAKEMTLYARFNKLGFVTPEIKPAIPSIVTPIMPGVPPTTPGERPNPVTPSTPGTDGNQTPSNGSGSNTGNTATTSPTTSQGGKLAKLGENNSLLLQVVGLLLVLSGVTFFLVKRKKNHS
ncbi:leucine-rich repeat domain-containing protein [Listeria monocytogenes]|nr:leucine-rich repeat domain-containing protein [Listeria monocytogenes]